MIYGWNIRKIDLTTLSDFSAKEFFSCVVALNFSIINKRKNMKECGPAHKFAPREGNNAEFARRCCRHVFCALFLITVPLNAIASELASTSYVQGAVASIVSALEKKANTDDLATVALSGNYDDLINKPILAPYYESRSNSISGAATGDSFSIDMDGFTFRATKQNQTNYWAVRVMNSSGEVRSISSSWTQIYGGHQGVTKENLAFVHGAEHNPDSEAGDLGYGKQDTGITYLFDHANMHLYKWVVTVYVDKAVMSVGRLH